MKAKTLRPYSRKKDRVYWALRLLAKLQEPKPSKPMTYIPTQTPEIQAAAMAKLEKQGFRFSNWIPAEPDADGGSMTELGCAVMVRRPNRYTHEYREVDPQGNVN